MADIPLTALRPAIAVQNELEWFFQRAESEVGIRSTYDGMVAQLTMGRSTGGNIEPVMEERRREAISRMRRVRTALAATDVQSQRILAAAYDPRAWGPEVRRVFPKPLDGVAFSMVGDLNTVIQKGKREAVRSLVVRCEKLFLDACAAYAANRPVRKWAA